MNEQNLDYLKNNIKYLGFGDKLSSELEKNLREGKPEFELNTSNIFYPSTLESTLHFRKSDTTDMYFLNKYDAKLQALGKEDREQTFHLDRGRGITAKEAFNLLEGRSAFKELTNKEGATYQSWLRLHFEQNDERGNSEVNQYHENYGYNLEAAVQNLRLGEMNEQQGAFLLKSLQKGNIEGLSLMDGDTEKTFYIAANPKFKTLDILIIFLLILLKRQVALFELLLVSKLVISATTNFYDQLQNFLTYLAKQTTLDSKKVSRLLVIDCQRSDYYRGYSLLNELMGLVIAALID